MAFGRHDFADAVHGENVLGHGITFEALRHTVWAG